MELDKTSCSGFQDVQEIYYKWASADFVIKSVTNPVLMPVYIVHIKTILYSVGVELFQWSVARGAMIEIMADLISFLIIME